MNRYDEIIYKNILAFGLYYMSHAPSREDLDRLTEVISSNVSATEAFIHLLRYLQSRGFDAPTELSSVDVDRSVSEVHEHLKLIFKSEPIPPRVTFLYFGLFDLYLSDQKCSGAGFYVSGGLAFDPANSDSLCDPVYFPENRMISSSLLRMIKSLALALPDSREFIDYTVMLGVGALLAKFALPVLNKPYRLIVGFDEGDFTEIKTLQIRTPRPNHGNCRANGN